MIVRKPLALLLLFALILLCGRRNLQAQITATSQVFGYTNFAAESKIEDEFLAVPSAKLAGHELKTLTAEPHLAATPEDHKTAEYVAEKFRADGLDTTIVPYRVLLNWPKVVRVQAYDAAGHLLMTGPTPEHVAGDRAGDNPRVVMPFNGSSASGDVTGEVVYANYGRLQDFDELAAKHIDLHGKIVICRYGANFRGVKVYIAEQRGAVGVLIYSDPAGRWLLQGRSLAHRSMAARPPACSAARSSISSSIPATPRPPAWLPRSICPTPPRIPAAGNQPHIISIPLSYHDAAPILQALKGPGVPQGLAGRAALPLSPGAGRRHRPSGLRSGLPAPHHLGRDRNHPGLAGSRTPGSWSAIIATPGSTARSIPPAAPPSMLEAVHGVGALLRHGWRPKRTLVFCSWDAEEEGLIGSTEWVEQNAQALEHAVAYFNIDVGVSGPDFTASAVPSLKTFIRQVAQSVPSPAGRNGL